MFASQQLNFCPGNKLVIFVDHCDHLKVRLVDGKQV